VLDCVVCGVPAHYVGGLGVRAGHWAHGGACAARDTEAPMSWGDQVLRGRLEQRERAVGIGRGPVDVDVFPTSDQGARPPGVGLHKHDARRPLDDRHTLGALDDGRILADGQHIPRVVRIHDVGGVSDSAAHKPIALSDRLESP
jgi:hypothetical protein